MSEVITVREISIEDARRLLNAVKRETRTRLSEWLTNPSMSTVTFEITTKRAPEDYVGAIYALAKEADPTIKIEIVTKEVRATRGGETTYYLVLKKNKALRQDIFAPQVLPVVPRLTLEDAEEEVDRFVTAIKRKKDPTKTAKNLRALNENAWVLEVSDQKTAQFVIQRIESNLSTENVVAFQSPSNPNFVVITKKSREINPAILCEAVDIANACRGITKIDLSGKYFAGRGKVDFFIKCSDSEEAKNLVSVLNSKFPELKIKQGFRDPTLVWVYVQEEKIALSTEGVSSITPTKLDVRKVFLYPAELDAFVAAVENMIKNREIRELIGKGVEIYINVNTRCAVVLIDGKVFWAGEAIIGKPNEDMWTPLGLFTVTGKIDNTKREYAYVAIPKYFEDFLECEWIGGFVVDRTRKFAAAKWSSIGNPFGAVKLEVTAPRAGNYKVFFGRTIKAPWLDRHIGGFVEVAIEEDPAFECTYGCIGINYVNIYKFNGTQDDLLTKDLFEEENFKRFFIPVAEGDFVYLKNGRKAHIKKNIFGDFKFYKEDGSAVLLREIDWTKSEKYVWVTKMPEENELYKKITIGTRIYVDGASVFVQRKNGKVEIVIKEGEYKDLLVKLGLKEPTTIGEILKRLKEEKIELPPEILDQLGKYATETAKVPYKLVKAEGE